MARFTNPGDGGGSGVPGPAGPQGDPGADGADGQDALWNFTGEWVNGIDYAAGSVVEFQGSTYYHPNGQFSSYSPPTNGWLLVSAKGADGADGTNGTNGADFGIYYLGNYVSTNGYITDIAVVRGSDGQLYLAKASGQLGDPIDYQSNGQWEVWIPKGTDGAQGPQGEPGLDANLDTGTTTINSYNPVWSGTDLTFTNTPTTGSYIKIGNLVQVQIDVLFTDVTDFGTGQYSLTIPLPSKYHTDVYGGSIHNITNQGIDHYSLKGHLSPASSTMTIWNIGSSAQDQPFDHNSPFILQTTDRLHMSFTYICE